MANKPVLHRRDHEHGGADPVRIVWESTGEAGEGGGGIQFDTYPQAGQWLYLETDGTDASPSGYGLEVYDSSGLGIDLASNGGITLHNTADGGVSITNTSDGGTLLQDTGGGDVHISSSARVVIGATDEIDIGAGTVVMSTLTFTDPHVYGGLYLTGANVVTMSGG